MGKWEKLHPNKMKFNEWLLEKYGWDIPTFVEKSESIQASKHREYLEYLEADNEQHEMIIDSAIKKSLNPKIWNSDNTLKPEIKEQIEKVVEKFKDWLDNQMIDINISDVVLVGSNASYNYNSKSDLDIHIIVPEADEMVLNLYDSYKTLFNKTYNIKFNKVPIELYVQNSLENMHSNSIYSIYKGWLKEPKKEEMKNLNIKAEMGPLLEEYQQVIASNDTKKVSDFIDKLYDMRQTSFAESGDFGKGNLIFKEFRKKGYLKKLKELLVKLESKALSIGDVIKKKPEGYVIYSEKGKRLSKAYKTKEEAEERLKQIEMFKHMKKDTKDMKSLVNEIVKKNYNNKSKIALLEIDGNSFVEKIGDETINFGKFQEHRYDDMTSYSFCISGGLNGSGNWKNYLGDIKTLFKKFEKELKVTPVLYNVHTDIADDVWNGYVFLYKDTPKEKMKDSLIKDSTSYKGYGIEWKGDYYQVWKYHPDGNDEKLGGDFVTEEEAMEFIDGLGSNAATGPTPKPKKNIKQLHRYQVFYVDYDSDQTMVEEVMAYSEADAKRRVKNMWGNQIYGYPHDAILIDSKKGAKGMKKDTLEEIKVELDEELDKLVEEGYHEYCKCLEKNKEGQFQYSEKLIELLNKISNFTATTETEVMGMFREMAEQEEVKGKEVHDSVSQNEYEDLVRASAHPEIFDFYDEISRNAADLFEEVYNKLGYPLDDEWIIHPDVLKDNAKMNKLYETLREEIIKKLNYDHYYFDSDYDKHYGQHEATETVLDLFGITKHVSYDSVKDATINNMEAYNWWSEHSKGFWDGDLILECRDKKEAKEYFDRMQAALPHIKMKLAKDFKDGYKIKFEKETIEDAGLYVYQFPADMTEEDIEELGKYELEHLGKVGENGFQPGDHLVRGTLANLKKYCKEFLGYVMHPDYLYKEKDIDLEDILVKDGEKAEDAITPAEGLIKVLKAVNVPQDSTFQYGNEKGLFLQIQNVGLDTHEDIVKYKHVSPKLSSLAWGRIWNKNELVFNEEKPINILKQDMIKFLEGMTNKIEDTDDEGDSNQIMDLLRRCQEILKRRLAKRKLTPEEAELEVRHEKTQDGKDMIVFNGNPEWQGTQFEEDVANELDDEITKLYYGSELKWWNNSAGCYWILEE